MADELGGRERLLAYLQALDDLQYGGGRGLDAFRDNMVPLLAVLGIAGLAADQIVKNWDRLVALAIAEIPGRGDDAAGRLNDGG